MGHLYETSTFNDNVSNIVLADDHSRVILEKIEGVRDSDYINASYVKVRRFCLIIVVVVLLLFLSFFYIH